MHHPQSLQYWVFGSYFIRKYYTLFVHGHKGESRRMELVCASSYPKCRIPPPVAFGLDTTL
jgi:hypothetical protein